MKTQLIEITDFESYVDIPLSVDGDAFNPYILKAQDVHLKSLIQKALYDDLVAKYADKANTPLSTDYQNLYDLIVPYLCYKSYAEYLPFSVVNATRFGPVQKKSTYSQPIDKETLGGIIQNIQATAFHYQLQIESFLTQNYKLYLLYDNSQPEEVNKNTGSVIIPIDRPSNNNNISSYLRRRFNF